MFTSIKQERFPSENQNLQGTADSWVKGKAQKGGLRRHWVKPRNMAVPHTSPPLMDTGWKGKQHLPGTVIVSAKALCPQTNTFTAVPMEGVPAHLSPPKHHPPAREEETQMEGRVESLAEEIKLWLHNLYTSVQPLPNVQSRTFSTSVNDTWSPQIWGKSTA